MTKRTVINQDMALPCEPTQWVSLHGDELLGFAMSRIDQQDVAEDLVQETFLAAWQARDSFDNRSNFRTWLIGILRRKIADHYRHQGRGPRQITSVASSENSHFDTHGNWSTATSAWNQTPQELAENMEFWDVLTRCVSNAPPHLALVFRLRELESLTVDEICERLDITRKHLSVRLYRARLALRECLQLNWFNHDSP